MIRGIATPVPLSGATLPAELPGATMSGAATLSVCSGCGQFTSSERTALATSHRTYCSKAACLQQGRKVAAEELRCLVEACRVPEGEQV